MLSWCWLGQYQVWFWTVAFGRDSGKVRLVFDDEGCGLKQGQCCSGCSHEVQVVTASKDGLLALQYYVLGRLLLSLAALCLPLQTMKLAAPVVGCLALLACMQ